MNLFETHQRQQLWLQQLAATGILFEHGNSTFNDKENVDAYF